MTLPTPPSLFGGLTIEEFLRDYWHKKPLLVRQAFPGYRCPVTPEELAGLACEDGVESRIIMEKDGARPWQAEHGPFPEERFTRLPATHWTVLVQEMNKHVPEFALLQDHFAFIPWWRLDDVMVSYAPAHGTVGPHADNYDVFLIQGLGHRRWQINRRAPGPDDLIPDLDLRIMKHWETEQEWVLEPGDMLYLPPGVAHYGVALDDCITVSVGFRAPNVKGMLIDFAERFIEAADPERFYADADLDPQADPGEISAAARARIRAIIRAIDLSDETIDRWFGRFVTEAKPGHDVPLPERELNGGSLKQRLAREGLLIRSEYCRMAHFTAPDGSLLLYVDGEELRLDTALAPLVRQLCSAREFAARDLAPWLDGAALELLADLHNRGALYFPED
ncbi:MAG: cupin domain-containing protein [Gammaproteobacteria bacterium]|nr:cupin domain-containing protein [Gammaproteobacteria bacterium]